MSRRYITLCQELNNYSIRSLQIVMRKNGYILQPSSGKPTKFWMEKLVVFDLIFSLGIIIIMHHDERMGF